jgi:ketosteroid isomerase-like protein
MAEESTTPDLNEQADFVRDYFASVNRRDFPRAMDAYADDVVLVVTGFFPDGAFSGREAVGRWFGEWFSAFGPDYHFDVVEVQEVDERLLVSANHRGRGRTSGIAVAATTWYAFTVIGGKITRLELYADRGDALKAVGIEE